MVEQPNLIKSMQLPPIKMQKYERYLPTAFDESLSILEKINKVINYLYEYSEITNEMLEKWNVVYYWAMNEGLQQSVTDQLNKWLEDGTLQSVINQESFGEIQANVDILINDLDSLKNDVLSMRGDIDTIKNEAVNLEGYYSNLKIERYVDEESNTTYYLGKVPSYDSDGNFIRLNHTHTAPVYGSTNLKTVRETSVNTGATLAINASTYSTTTGNIIGMYMKDGNVIQDNVGQAYNYILAFDDNNNMQTFPPNTSPSTIIGAGYNNAISSFIPLIENGLSVSDSVIATRSIFDQPHPRSAIAKDSVGNMYFFSCEGRTIGEYGMYAKDVIRVLLSHGMVFAQMLDGGGSADMVYYQSNVNMPSGGFGSEEREVGNILYVGKDETNKPANKLLKVMGDANMRITAYRSHLEELRYQRNNYIEMEEYLVNGWVNYGTQGSSRVRAWIMPNNTMYLVGTIKNGQLSVPFMQLPDDIAPMFTTDHLVAGNKENEIYKIRIGANGELQWYYWNTAGRPGSTIGNDAGTYAPDYIKLDGIFIPLNTPEQGIQRR